jgi:hypothetical protein
MKRAGETTLTVLFLVLAAACSSGSGSKKPAASATTSNSSTSSTGSSSSTSPTTAPPSTQAVATAFFAGWTAKNDAALKASGSAPAVSQAEAAWPAGTTGYVFSNCQGAAGSLYCTWVRPGERVVLQADNVTVPHRVVGFTHATLDAQDVAQEFVNAWQAGSTGAVAALGNTSAAASAGAASAQSQRPWAFGSCNGAAGSQYCTWSDGASTLTLQVQNVQAPRQVIMFTYKA